MRCRPTSLADIWLTCAGHCVLKERSPICVAIARRLPAARAAASRCSDRSSATARTAGDDRHAMPQQRRSALIRLRKIRARPSPVRRRRRRRVARHRADAECAWSRSSRVLTSASHSGRSHHAMSIMPARSVHSSKNSSRSLAANVCDLEKRLAPAGRATLECRRAVRATRAEFVNAHAALLLRFALLAIATRQHGGAGVDVARTDLDAHGHAAHVPLAVFPARLLVARVHTHAKARCRQSARPVRAHAAIARSSPSGRSARAPLRSAPVSAECAGRGRRRAP